MICQRGDVILAWFPFSSGVGGKRRPCLVVQNDRDNSRLTNTVIVQVTTNLLAANEPTQLLIDIATEDGKKTGLLHNSVVSCNNLATIEESLITKVIGALTPSLMTGVDLCLKATLALQ